MSFQFGALGSLVVELAANLSRFESDMGKANQVANRHMQQMQRVFTGIQGIIGGVVGGAMAMYVRSLINTAAELDRMSERTGHAVEWLSRLKVAANQNDVSMGELQSALTRFNVAMSEASEKTSRQRQLFDALGVDLTKGPTEAFRQFITTAARIDDPAARTNAFRVILGQTGDALIPLANRFDQAMDSADRLGATIDKQTTEQARQLTASLSTLRTVTEHMMVRALEPAITHFAKMAEEMANARDKADLLQTSLRNYILLAAKVAQLAPPFAGIFGLRAPDGKSLSELIEFLAKPPASFEPMGPNMGPQLPVRGAAVAAALSGKKPEEKDEEALDRLIRESLRRDDQQMAEWIAELHLRAQERLDAIALEREALMERTREEAEASLGLAFQRMLEEKEEFDHAWLESEFRRIMEARRMAEEEFAEHQKRLEEQTKRSADMARTLGMTFSSAFEDAIVKGKSLRDVIQGIAQDISRLVLRQMVVQPFANALTGAIQNWARPDWVMGPNMGPQLPAAPRALGGPVVAGRGYLVGELGPELLMPKEAGMIMPGSAVTAAQGKGDVTIERVDISISTPDAGSFRASRGQVLADVESMLRAAVRHL